METNAMTESNEQELKQDLLRKYSERSPKCFIQFDAFTDVEPSDPVVVPDKEGDSIFGDLPTYELMHGASVRLLVDPDVNPEAIVRCLEKIIDWISWDKSRNWREMAATYDPLSSIGTLISRLDYRKNEMISAENDYAEE